MYSRSWLGRPVPLSPVFEPIGDLRQGQTGSFRQRPLLIRSGIPVPRVALLQLISTPLFEAVDCFLTIPNRFW